MKPKQLGKVAVKEINNRMKKLCDNCGQLPEDKRLDITTGAGKWQKTKTYCIYCAEEWIQDTETFLADLRENLNS